MAVPPAPLPPGAGAAEPVPDWRRQLRDDPGSIEARFGLARAALAQGDAASATAWLSDACRVAPGHVEAAVRLAQLLLAQDLPGQALPVYRRLYADLGARDRVALLQFGQCLERTGALDEAIERYREAAVREPGLVEAHVALVRVLGRTGDAARALAHAQAAVNLGPDQRDALDALAQAVQPLRGQDRAATVASAGLALPADAVARVLVALGGGGDGPGAAPRPLP